jgi:ABC-type transporter Mla subunit MlaD
MPSPSERRRNNVRAGLFVSIALILALVIVIVLSGVVETLTRRTQRYTVRYPVASGVNNLKPGGEVRVGGMGMGRVVEVSPSLRPDHVFDMIEVEFKLDARITLYADASVYVSAPLLGTDAWLDIPSVGTKAAGAPPDGFLTGATAAGMLAAMLGTENAEKASSIMGNAEKFSEFLAEVPAQYDERVVPILERVGEASEHVRLLTEQIETRDWPEWSADVDRIMTWATGFTENLDATLDEGKLLITDARDVVGENREDVRNIVRNVEATTEDTRAVAARLRAETVDKVHALLDSGRDALDRGISVIETMRDDYTGWAVQLAETLGNASLASQQLKLTMIEVRRNPWKLLYRPSTDEIEHELLYDATRSFAIAAADLKAASNTVRGILDAHPAAVAADEDLYRRLRQTLLDPLDKYERAQARLLDVLFEAGP